MRNATSIRIVVAGGIAIVSMLAPGPAWSAGPAVGWGANEYEQAKIPGGLDGAEGKATAISISSSGVNLISSVIFFC